MDRVLEVGGAAAGYCGRLLVQAGCEVVRIESARREPQWASATAMDAFLHAGKRRVRTDDAALVGELASAADVVVLQARDADAVEAAGFDHWAAPVRVALTPFGRTGPKRNWQATQNTLLAMGGYTRLSGDPQRTPLTLPGHYVDFQAGALACTALNAAQLGGRPASIDIGMLETVMALSQFTTVMWHCAGEVRTRHGSDLWSVCPVNQFRCADAWVVINIVPAFWDAFTVFLERPDLLLDPRFTSNDDRRAHRAALFEIIEAQVAQWTRDEVDARALEARIPVGLVKTLDEVLADPHLAARDFWQPIALGDGNRIRAPRGGWHTHGTAPAELHLSEAEPTDG